MNDRPHYPWNEGDELFASELNAAIANSVALAGGMLPLNGSAPMTGPLTLAGNAAQPLQAVPLQQVQTVVNAGPVISSQTITAVAANTVSVPAGTNYVVVQDSIHAVNTLTVGSGTLVDGYDLWMSFPNGGACLGEIMPPQGKLTLKSIGNAWQRMAKEPEADYVNVLDYGAALDGVANDGAAFTAARARANTLTGATAGGGVVAVPYGYHHITSGGPTYSAPAVLWKADGLTFTGGTVPVTNIVTGDLVEGFFDAGKYYQRTDPAGVNHGGGVMRIDYTGKGTSFGVLRVNSINNDGSGYTWGVVSTLNLSQTGAGQPTAIAGTITRTAGATPGFVYFGSIVDQTGLPPASSAQSVGFELDLNQNGPENPASTYKPSIGARVNLNLQALDYIPASWAATHAYAAGALVGPGNGYVYIVQTAGTSGSSPPVWPTSAGTVVDGTVTWKFGTTVASQVSRAIDVDTQGNAEYGSACYARGKYYDAVIEMSEAVLDTSFNPTVAGIRMAANMPIDFSGDGTQTGQNNHTLGYNSSTTRWSYKLGTVEYLAVADNGSVITGKGSAGATTDTGGHLLIPFCAGTPTGVPANAALGIALRYDTTNHKLWAYDNGTSAWKGVALT